jgi:hypothetical protein
VISRTRKCGAIVVAAFGLLPCAGWSQESRLKGSIESSLTTPLPGHIHPLAQERYDQGPAGASRLISPITLVLKRSVEQQAALDRLLQDQQDPASGQYHRWLTPEQFGQPFGFSPGDIKTICTWLESQGFKIVEVPASRNLIVFRGTVQTVQSAFRTSIHEYVVEGERHIANSTAPSVPAELEPLVLAITGLHDFHPRATPIPEITFTDGSHNVGPADYAVIYDILPLNQAGFTGTGEKIAVVGQCNIALTDVQKFRGFFSLPANNPQLILAAGSADPGPKGTNPGDCGEAYLDVEWSGGIASAATIEYVYATDVFFAVQYAISHNIGNVVSMSFGGCEQDDSPSVGTTNQALAQQGNAQGITWVASSGDAGAAACDDAFSSTAPKASGGLAVSLPASIPEVTAVGGTQFNEGSGMYWSSSSGAGNVSALSYIPEAGWNESGSGGLASSGGGLSTFFMKPAWQTGPGVPPQNQRAVPDVSLTAAQHDGYYGFSGGNTVVFAGTSAATPAFAAVLAILDQYQVSKGFQAKPGQGNINPKLYHLAQSSPSSFHDVTSGNNIVPCTTGSTNCTTGSFGYSAGPGYDMVTGLGSVDVNNLTVQWSGQTVTPPAVTVVDKVTSNLIGNACSVPPQVTSFTTQDVKVWLYFDVTGAKVGDSAKISFLRPDGTLYTNVNVPVSSVGTNGSICFTTSIDIASVQTASYLGTWSIEVFWDQSATPLFTLNFTLSQSGPPPTKQIFPHIASDNEWHTDVFVLNTNSTSATFSLVFHTDTGAPMPLIGNPVTTNVILAPGGMAFFRTAPATASNNGWAELDSSVALTGVVVYSRHGADGRYYEASAPLSSPYSSFTVPVDETVSPLGSGFLNGFALANTDPGNSTQVNCTAYGTGGSNLGGLQVGPLSPLQHTEFLLGSSFAGQRGTLVCRSATSVAAVELRAISSSPAVSSMPVITSTVSVAQGSSQIFPHIASDNQWHTDIFVLNPNSTAANFSLVFHTDTAGAAMPLDGNPQTSNVALPPNGMAFFRTSPATTSNNAWAELDSSAALTGVVVYGRHVTDGSYYEASAPLGLPYSSFTVPFDETMSPLGSAFLDGFALANTDAVNAAQVTCTAYGAGGNIVGSGLQVAPLGPLKHAEFLVDQQFGSSLAGQRGTLACRSTTHVAAVELRAISSSPAVSSLPVIPSASTTLR